MKNNFEIDRGCLFTIAFFPALLFLRSIGFIFGPVTLICGFWREIFNEKIASWLEPFFMHQKTDTCIIVGAGSGLSASLARLFEVTTWTLY